MKFIKIFVTSMCALGGICGVMITLFFGVVFFVPSKTYTTLSDYIFPPCGRWAIPIDSKFRIVHHPPTSDCVVYQYHDAIVGHTGYEDTVPTVWRITPDGVVVEGVMGVHTTVMFKVLSRMPHKKVFILNHIDGTYDMVGNIKVFKDVYAQKYTTIVPKGGKIASGGSAFFASGYKRLMHPSAKIGIHSWSDTYEQQDAPPDRTSKGHMPYLEFYDYVNVPRDFYWRSLEIPSDDMYYLTIQEAQHYLNVDILGD